MFYRFSLGAKNFCSSFFEDFVSFGSMSTDVNRDFQPIFFQNVELVLFETQHFWNIVQRIFYYPKGLLEATVVGDIFPLSHPTIDVQIHFLQFISRVLIYNALRPFTKRLNSGIVPPLHQIAVFVELATLIIETMSNLMTDYYTDTAIIQGLGKVLRVKKRLQNPRRKY